MNDLPEPVVVLELLGRRCPLPVIELAQHIADVAPGEVIGVHNDDAAAAVDIAAWCRMRGHEYVGARDAEAGATYLVRRV